MTRPTLARTAAILCGDPAFQRFLATSHPLVWDQYAALPASERAAAVLRHACGIRSRKELDSDTNAQRAYHQRIGLPFSTWRQEQAK